MPHVWAPEELRSDVGKGKKWLRHLLLYEYAEEKR
jgi:hypothetical protein